MKKDHKRSSDQKCEQPMFLVTNILEGKNIPYRLVPLKSAIKSHADINGAASEVDPNDDCKTIITKNESGQYFALFLPGMKKINFGNIKRQMGESLSIINPAELLRVTGKVPGTVCPLLLENMKILVDESVLRREKLFFSSGEPNYGLEIYASNLKKLIHYTVLVLSQQ